MTRAKHPPMTGGEFDRDAATRLSEAALDAAWAEHGTRLLRVREGTVAVRSAAERSARLDLVPVAGPRTQEMMYLGRHPGGRSSPPSPPPMSPSAPNPPPVGSTPSTSPPICPEWKGRCSPWRWP